MKALTLRQKFNALKVDWLRAFTLTTGALLLACALTKLLGVVGLPAHVAMSDSILGVPLHYSLLAIAMSEGLVACLCLFGRSSRFILWLLAWLALNLIVYGGSSFFMGSHPYASALVNPANPLRLPARLADMLNLALPFYLLIGSVAALWLEQRAAEKRINYLKISCHACGGHIKFPMQNIGRRIPCPHCQTEIALRKSERLKMSCFFCQGHIEFPTHAIGEKISCPHCNGNITLKESA
jgi:DNA-directed RNA polymerase subunit RPC12/RpoP